MVSSLKSVTLLILSIMAAAFAVSPRLMVPQGTARNISGHNRVELQSGIRVHQSRGLLQTTMESKIIGGKFLTQGVCSTSFHILSMHGLTDHQDAAAGLLVI